MELYHATVLEYQKGCTYTIADYEGENHFYQNLNSEKKAVEEKLERCRPKDIFQRSKCFFFFDNPNYCAYFFSKEYPNEPIHIYKVEVPNAKGGFPMCLVNEGLKQIEQIEYIVKEYWCPNQKWFFLEYLGDQMTVIEEIIGSNNCIMALMHYDIDIENVSKIKIK